MPYDRWWVRCTKLCQSYKMWAYVAYSFVDATSQAEESSRFQGDMFKLHQLIYSCVVQKFPDGTTSPWMFFGWVLWRIGNQDKFSKWEYFTLKVSPHTQQFLWRRNILEHPFSSLLMGCHHLSCLSPCLISLCSSRSWYDPPYSVALSTWHFPTRPLPFTFHEPCPSSQSAHVLHAVLTARLENRWRRWHSLANHKRPTFALFYHDID